MVEKKEEVQVATLEDMIKKGTINILAIGYKGTEAWRSKREPLKKIENEKKD